MNRRNWLKSGALLAGSVSLLPTGLDALAAPRRASPAVPSPLADVPADEQALLGAPAPIKALVKSLVQMLHGHYVPQV